MRNVLLFLLFFLVAPLTIFASIFLYSYHMHQTILLGQSNKPRPIAYAALPTTENLFAGAATLSDSRAIVLNQFFSYYHSPLAAYADLIVSKADEYNIDYRLLPAIAMQETTLCQKTLKQSPYNCWGWGIWGKKVTTFTSFADAIDTISRYFGNRKAKGIVTLDEIATIYNPGDTNHWKEHVAHFMSEL